MKTEGIHQELLPKIETEIKARDQMVVENILKTEAILQEKEVQFQAQETEVTLKLEETHQEETLNLEVALLEAIQTLEARVQELVEEDKY